MFIVLEGIDGSGKTTIAKELVNYFKKNNRTAIYTREPGGLNIEFSESIREIIFKYDQLNPITLTMLFLASRIEHIKQFIIPNLKSNNIIICDRYYYSSIVYQGILEKIGKEFVFNLNKEAIEKIDPRLLSPDYVFFINLNSNTARERKLKLVNEKNYFDEFNIEKYEALNKAYADTFSFLKTKNIYIINGNQKISEIVTDITDIIKKN